jgi:hypothetical protein
VSRRTSTRRDVLLPCQAVREEDFVLVADRTLDLSAEGMLLPMNHTRVLTGDELIVSFMLPKTRMWIDAEAIVTRVVHGRRPGDDGLAFAIMFDVMSSSSRAALAGYLHGRPPPLPRRGPMARLRRGLEAPRLADHALMETTLATSAPEPPIDDVVDEVDVQTIEEIDDGPFDPLVILREVADAWRKLAV